jgi:DNA-binding PadR family transcriptional regulator
MGRIIDDVPPLSPLTMSILLALAGGETHGYALMKEVERQSEGVLKPGTGSLYAALQRLIDAGLIDEAAHVAAPREDSRRKHYRITVEGRRATRAEAARMMRVLEIARARSLAPDVEPGGRGEA